VLIASTSSPAPSVTKNGSDGRSPASTSPMVGRTDSPSVNARRVSTSGTSINDLAGARLRKCSQLRTVTSKPFRQRDERPRRQ
jgi:hypothetical protein